MYWITSGIENSFEVGGHCGEDEKTEWPRRTDAKKKEEKNWQWNIVHLTRRMLCYSNYTNHYMFVLYAQWPSIRKEVSNAVKQKDTLSDPELGYHIRCAVLKWASCQIYIARGSNMLDGITIPTDPVYIHANDG